MAKSQPSVRMETCECVEAQGDRAGHPSLNGRGTDRDSGLELEGGSARVWWRTLARREAKWRSRSTAHRHVVHRRARRVKVVTRAGG